MEDINVIYGEERIKRRGKYLVANIGSTLLIDVRDWKREAVMASTFLVCIIGWIVVLLSEIFKKCIGSRRSEKESLKDKFKWPHYLMR